LYQERTLARFPCMHSRLYIVPSEDLDAYHQATNIASRRGLEGLVADLLARTTGHSSLGLPHGDEIVQRVLEVTSTRGPCTIAELSELLPALDAIIPHDPDRPEAGYARLGTRLIPALCAQGLLIRAQARGSWRSELYTYVSLSSWLPQANLGALSPQKALQRVVLSYLSAFGPVTVGDISHWLGGVRRRHIIRALRGLGNSLSRLQISGSPGEYFMLRNQVAALLDYQRDERAVCLLPPRDSLVMAYSGTRGFLPMRYRERVFGRADEALGTIWVDGCVVGVWWLQLRGERILARLFEAVDPEAMALVVEEARLLGQFLGFSTPEVGVGLYPDENDADEISGLNGLDG